MNWLILRGFLVDGKPDAASKMFRDSLKVYPLAKAANPPAMEFINCSTVPRSTIHANTFAFYEELDHVIQKEPIGFIDPELRGLAASIGIRKGTPFAPDERMKNTLTEAVAVGNATARTVSFHNRDPRAPIYENSQWKTREETDALVAGMADGQRAIDERRASLGGKTDMLFGDRMFLKNDFVARATGTQVGIGANSREEALYPILDTDAHGNPLDGRADKYRLRFAEGELPPVQAFWSITMYDLPRQLLVRNPLNRYLINSSMLPELKTDGDGGLTIDIQADSPGVARESNWLPAPRGPFVMFMRYYWPKPALLSGDWVTPAVVKV